MSIIQKLSIVMPAYNEAYLDEVVETQGKLFAYIAYDFRFVSPRLWKDGCSMQMVLGPSIPAMVITIRWWIKIKALLMLAIKMPR